MRFDAAEAALTLRTVAKIHEDPRGGPVRIIINGRHRKPTGRYTSAKARRAMPWEDRAERMFFWLCEADTAVVSFLAQPHCLEMKVAGGGRSLLYYPDVRRDMADGRVEIREIKSRDAGTRRRDPDYAHKLELAHEVYARLGWDFEILDQDEDIERPRPRLATAKEIQRRRRVKVDTRDRFALIEAIERQGGIAPLQTVIEALGGEPVGRAKVYAAVVRRFVHLPLDRRLSDDTPVTLVTGGLDASHAGLRRNP
jgi:hypothetical protein